MSAICTVDTWPVVACGLFAALLIMPNLGDRCLWQDEAQTALISKSILVNGIPKGADDRNSFSQESGRDIGPDGSWRWHPWFPFYWQAAFFAALGTGTWSARVAFAVFGVATAMLVQLLGTKLFGCARVGFIAAVLLAINVPFLLLMRQGRYFGPDAFFTVLGLFAYWSAVVCPSETAPKRAWLVLVLSLVLLFHTQFLHCAALMTAMIAHASVFNRRHVPPLLIALSFVVVIVAPWAYWFAGAHAVDAPHRDDVASKIHLTVELTALWGQWVLSPAIIVAAVPLVFAKRFREELCGDLRHRVSAVTLLATFVGILIIACGFTVPQAWFRYLTPVIAPSCVLMGWVVDRGMRWWPAIGPIVIAVAAVISPLREYVHEITHHFHGPVEAIVEHLNRRARPGDIVVISYDDMAVKFYTSLRVLGGLTGESLAPSANASWLIMRAFEVCSQDAFCRGYVAQNVDPANYESHRLACGDAWIDNIEDPRFHRYQMTGEEPPLYIYHRVRGQ